MDTVYVVTGAMRSGTSMMMRCLETGGMTVAYDGRRNFDLGVGSPLHPYVRNPDGFYELDGPRWRTPAEIDALRGKAVKMLAVHASTLCEPTDDVTYRVVVMARDPDEILSSARRAFGLKPFEGPDEYAERIGWLVGYFFDRPDVASITQLSFAAVVADPATELAKLADDGWPLDVAAAAEVPTQRWWRHRVASDGRVDFMGSAPTAEVEP